MDHPPRPSTDGTSDRRVSPQRSDVAVALDCCRDAIGPEIANGARLESMRGFVAAFAEAARRDLVPPERTLALFKRMLSELPEIQRHRADERGHMTSQLAQMVIESYYDGVVQPRVKQ
jgi:hypothetical protein